MQLSFVSRMSRTKPCAVLFDGRRLRALTVVDAYTREALTIEVDQGIVDQGIKGEQVVDAVTRIAVRRGAPRTIRVDNGPEFVSKALDRWAYESAVTLDFSRPGKPTDNAFVESFNGRLRDECLNTHWFLSLADARTKIEAWRRDYTRAVLIRRLAGRRRTNTLPRRLGKPPNERRNLTFRVEEKPGDPHMRSAHWTKAQGDGASAETTWPAAPLLFSH